MLSTLIDSNVQFVHEMCKFKKHQCQLSACVKYVTYRCTLDPQVTDETLQALLPSDPW